MSGKTHNSDSSSSEITTSEPDGALSPAAQRALAEAQARRLKAQNKSEAQPKEEGGRGGKDPARYGDWEINGRAIDF